MKKFIKLLGLLVTTTVLAQSNTAVIPNDTLALGKSGQAVNKTIEFNLTKPGASGNPRIRFNYSTSQFEFSNNGSVYSVLGAFTSPMTTLGDMIYGGASGVGTRIGIGSPGQVLTVASGIPSWATLTGLTNPMTTAGDIIVAGTSGVANRLAAGSSGQVLAISGGVPAWTPTPSPVPLFDSTHIGLVNASGGGTTNFLRADNTWVAPAGAVTSVGLSAPSIFTVTGSPVTSSGTLALSYSGTALPLANGGTGTAAGSANAAFNALSPMTTSGDIIYGGASGVGTRLAKGTDGQALVLASGIPAWQSIAVSSQSLVEATPTPITGIRVPNNQFTNTAAGTRLVETGNGNVLVNPDNEGTNASDGYTIGNATATDEATNVLSGKKSMKLSLSSQNGTVYTQTINAGSQVVGQNWEYTASYKTTLAGFSFCARQNGVELSCQNVVNDGNWHTYTSYLPANSVSNGIELDQASSSTGIIYADYSYVGPARGLGVGSVDTPWTTYSATILGSTTNPTPAAGATSTARWRRVGDSMEIMYWFTQAASGGSSGTGTYIFPVPTGYAIDTTKVTATTANTNAVGADVVGMCNFSNIATAQTSVATTGPVVVYDSRGVALFGNSGTAGVEQVIGSGSFSLSGGPNPVSFSFRAVVPIVGWQATNIFNPSLYQSSWSGYQNGISSGCTTTSATFADPSACTGITLNQATNQNFSTVTTAASSAPGITFTPTSASTFLVLASVQIQDGTGANNISTRMLDQSSFILDQGKPFLANLTSARAGIPLMGIVSVAAGVTETIRVQIASDTAATVSIGTSGLTQVTPAISWQIVNLTKGISTPVLTGNVTSNSTGSLRIESLGFGGSSSWGNCTSSPCTVINPTTAGWATVTWSSTGTYALVIPAGTFSAAPNCTITSNSFASSGEWAFINSNPSTTGFVFVTRTSAGVSNTAGVITCIGPR